MFRATVPPSQRLCLALLLAIGFALLYAIAVGLGNEARKALLGIDVSSSYEQVVFTSDGEVLVETAIFNGRSRRYDYRSLDGAVIAACAFPRCRLRVET